MRRAVDRRTFLQLAASAGAVLLAACGGTAAKPSVSNSSGQPRWGMTPEQEAAWQQVEAAARKEGSLTYYGQGHIPDNQIPVFLDAWAKDYPDIKVDLVNAGSPSDTTARVSAEQDSKNYVGDLAEASGRVGRQMAGLGYTQAYVPPAAVDPGVQWLASPAGEDDKGLLVAEDVTYHPLWINTNLVQAGQAPKTRMDLTDPKWSGKLVFYTPWTEGGGWAEYYFAKQLYGMEWVTRMQAQNVTWAASPNQMLDQLARGEYAIAVGPPGGAPATKLIRDGQPVNSLWMDDFTQGQANGHVLLTGAPHPNAAKVMLNWLVSTPGEQLRQKLGFFPLRADIPPSEDWMKGVAHPKQHFNLGDVPDEASAAAQKEAAAHFKK